MKKRIVLGALVALLVLTAMPVVAQAGRTLTIGGLVPLTLELDLAPLALAQNLPLIGSVEDFEQDIAALTITTNNTAGWELWVYSENGAVLRNVHDDEIEYRIRFGGAFGEPTFDIPEGFGDGGLGRLIASDTTTSDTGNLIIQYTQTETFPAGYYSDQLAVVLRAQ